MGNVELEVLKNIIPMLAKNASVVVGAGDDCAAVEFKKNKLLLLAADQVISSVHYKKDTSPELIGEKLMKRNLSDIAAMGGKPLWALLTISTYKKNAKWCERFILGAEKSGQKYGVCLIGGDIASLKEEGSDVSTLTIVGEVKRDEIILRTGAKIGDYLCVSGRLGNSFFSQRHLTFTPQLSLAKVIAKNKIASSMLDISDGLLLDAMRLSQASKVGFEIDLPKIPLHHDAKIENALSDGEDYELLFTVSPDKIDIMKKVCEEKKYNISIIGKAIENIGIFDIKTKENLLLNRKIGYEH